MKVIDITKDKEESLVCADKRSSIKYMKVKTRLGLDMADKNILPPKQAFKRRNV